MLLRFFEDGEVLDSSYDAVAFVELLLLPCHAEECSGLDDLILFASESLDFFLIWCTKSVEAGSGAPGYRKSP
jgi:hypothetical protein